MLIAWGIGMGDRCRDRGGVGGRDGNGWGRGGVRSGGEKKGGEGDIPEVERQRSLLATTGLSGLRDRLMNNTARFLLHARDTPYLISLQYKHGCSTSATFASGLPRWL